MRYKATVAYDGHRYAGFQKQINGTGIQSLIEKALEKIIKEPVSITASGRTDAGVHALGQVFHFDGPEKIGERGYYNALNTLLPKDIRILKVEAVSNDFHARFSARSKRYDYVITTERDNPFSYNYKHFVWRSLDLEKMRQGAAILQGTHDFTSFSNAQIDPRKPRTKTIYSIDVIPEGKDIRIVYRGTGFLRYQVRMMSAVLIAAGEGRIAPDDIARMLEARDKHACRFNAPACGLYLVEVGYEEVQPEKPE
ncbi:tRNA pseudouridine(38-40) synthase TruA [Allobaculum mucilyticum]|uniref:tRNA pseudouridine(38-40) synthase TruA n=1 Tax=Allobaculum mucilyticum TaxID=2834459 RepID=UPI001E5647F4|nr:tRNA pseudouridine(38-40) synthase TruA [Allobaculum mucilyticum]UNT95342.1 tRNA pseudouridine(38-40) synthase TruA [Allobaculum mucilyticum]